MSAAELSFCAVLQLSHSVPALEVKNYEGYLRWARLAKWHSHPARCQLPRKLPNWHLVHEIRPVMSKRYLITMCKQGSPSGHRNWRLTEDGEDTRQLHVSLKLTHLFLFYPIYRTLLWALGRLKFCISKEVLLVYRQDYLGDCFTRGQEESSCCRGGAAGLEPTSLVVTSSGTLLLSINEVCMFSYILVLHRCFVFTCIFYAT